MIFVVWGSSLLMGVLDLLCWVKVCWVLRRCVWFGLMKVKCLLLVFFVGGVLLLRCCSVVFGLKSLNWFGLFVMNKKMMFLVCGVVVCVVCVLLLSRW